MLTQALSNSGRRIHKFHFLDKYLSPVRNQRQGAQCAYTATITCIEMIHHILGIKIDSWSGPYYFNIDDVFNSLYNHYPNHPRAKEKHANKRGEGGTQIKHVLDFVKDIGLKVSTECYDPRYRDYLSGFDYEVERHKIASYKRLLGSNEVISCLKRFPVITLIYSCRSFKDCVTVLYNGPSAIEINKAKADKRCHAVVIVGFVYIESQGKKELHFILQNSYGEIFGFKGFAVVRYVKDFFLEFWEPVKGDKTDPVRI
ncbi:ervatamin-B-like [Dorcoceras hygrometricum]|uniref:Ervatamin-B-like n=1 Tax=Dorcoceras hygrometricum TaxID=472368 RepID=A0A2Z7B6T1_9LAMI|nr:ervatamin-B-like [Dorcoceras hygrometricum]